MSAPRSLAITEKAGAALAEFETLARERDRTAAEEMALLVRNFDDTHGDLVAELSLVELLTVHVAWMRSGWDFYPHQWTARQLDEAKRGRPPSWDENEEPTYGPSLCSVCGTPAHASETDELDRCASCRGES